MGTTEDDGRPPVLLRVRVPVRPSRPRPDDEGASTRPRWTSVPAGSSHRERGRVLGLSERTSTRILRLSSNGARIRGYRTETKMVPRGPRFRDLFRVSETVDIVPTRMSTGSPNFHGGNRLIGQSDTTFKYI